MQIRAFLLAFALFGAGCRSVSAPAAAPTAAPTAPPLPPLPQFVLQPAWELWPEPSEALGFSSLWHVGDLEGDGFEDVAAEAYHFGLDLYTTDSGPRARRCSWAETLGAFEEFAPDADGTRVAGWKASLPLLTLAT